MTVGYSQPDSSSHAACREQKTWKHWAPSRTGTLLPCHAATLWSLHPHGHRQPGRTPRIPSGFCAHSHATRHHSKFTLHTRVNLYSIRSTPYGVHE
ncbi:uncharacterized protein EI97DRAFT_46291 [Westerdykella ornata]|uniref:Uncharacterized protein n=1 Tax=Westerdykella ornata TaxID=318751 RepID=A0A6A6JIJ3_WESOR|nr:uncharacterized protein EI97DRAFT_46291 [Westerdykella ornata]KAF2276034.1 hypothetical protein EI97DRAFT_46291 [Westerdykella ornata]